MYGTGAPLWGKGESLSSPQQQQQQQQSASQQQRPGNNNNNSTLNNRYHQSTSYQKSQGSYQPPNAPPGATYAEQQTNVMTDTVRTQYQSEATAQTVLSQMTTQRYQLQNAHDNVWEMRETTEKAKRELADLAAKNRKKKRRLYGMIMGLGLLDLVLFVRILFCGGSFFCRRY